MRKQLRCKGRDRPSKANPQQHQQCQAGSTRTVQPQPALRRQSVPGVQFWAELRSSCLTVGPLLNAWGAWGCGHHGPPWPRPHGAVASSAGLRQLLPLLSPTPGGCATRSTTVPSSTPDLEAQLQQRH